MFRLANPKDREKALGSRKLLLIDDDSDVVTLAGQILADAGYSVFSTSDPGEAIRLLSDRRVRIDLLITDVFMPGMTGPDLARTGFRNRAELRVLFHVWRHQGSINCQEGGQLSGQAVCVC